MSDPIILTDGMLSKAPGDSIVSFVTKAFETQDEFIFETIRPFCEEKTGMSITKDELIRALTLLREQEKSRWVSVKDRLPEAAGYECLVCAVNENYNQTHVFTAFTGYGEPGWWTSNVHYMSRAKSPTDNRLHPALKVTHWMPLPEPPKEVSGDV